jgi:pimeloyl-ACP methyl ester carboxylesterase
LKSNNAMDTQRTRRSALGIGVAAVATAIAPTVRAAADETYQKIPVPGGSLSYFDTGGNGPTVVLLHPASGDLRIWENQRAAFREAGFRLIAYGRRGYSGSTLPDVNAPTAVSHTADLFAVVDTLGLKTFHLIGVAAGGFMVADAAVAQPSRIRSITIVSSLSGISEPSFLKDTARILPPKFGAIPVIFRELSPAYRFANPEGTARWAHIAEDYEQPWVRLPGTTNPVTYATLESIKMPAHLVTGESDLYMPPTRLRDVAKHLPHANVTILAGAAHAPHWETPEPFNAAVLAFLKRIESGAK